MAALAKCRVPMFWFTLMLSPTNSPFFFSQISTPSFPINWPPLVSTARSPLILWRLWCHKPSHKHDANRYHSKAIVICDHKSDQVCDAREQSIPATVVWLMFRVLSNQHYQHRTNQKLRSWANAAFSKSWDLRASVSFFPLPLPCHSFFCSRPNLLDELARKRLLRRLNLIQLLEVIYQFHLYIYCSDQ